MSNKVLLSALSKALDSLEESKEGLLRGGFSVMSSFGDGLISPEATNTGTNCHCTNKCTTTTKETNSATNCYCVNECRRNSNGAETVPFTLTF